MTGLELCEEQWHSSAGAVCHGHPSRGGVCRTGAVPGCISAYTPGGQDIPLGSDTPSAPSQLALTMLTLPSRSQVLRVPVSLPMWEQFVIAWS